MFVDGHDLLGFLCAARYVRPDPCYKSSYSSWLLLSISRSLLSLLVRPKALASRRVGGAYNRQRILARVAHLEGDYGASSVKTSQSSEWGW
jgi:hypothetical protein